MFKAILIKNTDQIYQANIAELGLDDLPKGEVLVQVSHSSINYKDALAITGKSPVVRQFPMVPGIDLAGKVLESSVSQYKVGDWVLLNGWGVGEKHWGGLAQMARLDAKWLIPLPKKLTSQQAMSVGTAGYTAMLAIIALERNGITPQSGKILVTGASGGVGGFSVAFLSRLGYEVIASTGGTDAEDYLRNVLGASEIMDRRELLNPCKSLMKERWAAVIDSVGSHTLVNACASTVYGGVVAACGLAQGMDFNGSVAPFILRGISLVGIDSVMRPYEDRVYAWQRLSELVDEAFLEEVCTKITLSSVISSAFDLLSGNVRGRIVVDLESGC